MWQAKATCGPHRALHTYCAILSLPKGPRAKSSYRCPGGTVQTYYVQFLDVHGARDLLVKRANPATTVTDQGLCIAPHLTGRLWLVRGQGLRVRHQIGARPYYLPVSPCLHSAISSACLHCIALSLPTPWCMAYEQSLATRSHVGVRRSDFGEARMLHLMVWTKPNATSPCTIYF